MNRQIMLALGYALLILGLSTIPGQYYPKDPLFTHDKIIHFIEYAGFAMILVWATPNLKNTYMIVIFASAFGVADELYQSFIPGRDSSAADWATDTVGAVVGVIAAKYWQQRK